MCEVFKNSNYILVRLGRKRVFECAQNLYAKFFGRRNRLGLQRFACAVSIRRFDNSCNKIFTQKQNFPV